MSDNSFERRLAGHAGAAALGMAIALFAQSREKNRIQQAYEMLVSSGEMFGEKFPTIICKHCSCENAIVGLDDICFSCGRLLKV